jgi:hypothetical protein
VADPFDLTLARCLVHPQREAAARCPECRSYFCRECVTEYLDRAVCASCLRRLARAEGERRDLALRAAIRTGQLLLGMLAAWFFFYVAGEFLASLPDRFHETSRLKDIQGAP